MLDPFSTGRNTGSPSSKYEHWRTSAWLLKIQNIRISLRKKPIVSVTYEIRSNCSNRLQIPPSLVIVLLFIRYLVSRRLCTESELKGRKSLQPFPSEAIDWAPAWTPRYRWKIATRPETQITHTRGGRQSLAPVDINTKQREQETVSLLLLDGRSIHVQFS